ncbi:UNVERIFIED_CONTAM: hypothetical protein GTU68_026320 [Idotea baltica]|nr:hypothetical protein [Idotea baltica]
MTLTSSWEAFLSDLSLEAYLDGPSSASSETSSRG